MNEQYQCFATGEIIEVIVIVIVQIVAILLTGIGHKVGDGLYKGIQWTTL